MDQEKQNRSLFEAANPDVVRLERLKPHYDASLEFDAERPPKIYPQEVQSEPAELALAESKFSGKENLEKITNALYSEIAESPYTIEKMQKTSVSDIRSFLVEELAKLGPKHIKLLIDVIVKNIPFTEILKEQKGGEVQYQGSNSGDYKMLRYKYASLIERLTKVNLLKKFKK